MNRFRPLTASKVSEHKPVVLKLRVVNRFRPLSGNKVSELYILCVLIDRTLHIDFRASGSQNRPC